MYIIETQCSPNHPLKLQRDIWKVSDHKDLLFSKKIQHVFDCRILLLNIFTFYYFIWFVFFSWNSFSTFKSFLSPNSSRLPVISISHFWVSLRNPQIIHPQISVLFSKSPNHQSSQISSEFHRSSFFASWFYLSH